jgi:predicted amidohydrolase YtcJ
MAGHGTRHVTLGGRAVIPGIFDSHNHLMEVGAKLSTVRLDVCQSQEEMMELVREQARDTPSGRVDRRPGGGTRTISPTGACRLARTSIRPPTSTP